MPDISTLKGLKNDEGGVIVDKAGNVIGYVVEGDPSEIYGWEFNERGEVVDDQGTILLRAELSAYAIHSIGEEETGSTDKAQHDVVAIEDWSGTGRGSHVDFLKDEVVPLEQGLWLGQGTTGDVHEVTIQGWRLAHKRMVVRRKLGDKEKKEIEILKRLPAHDHIIQLIGTYTHRQFLGILLYPVAVCDLHTFFQDAEDWYHTADEFKTSEARLSSLDPSQKDRLMALGYDFPETNNLYNASLAYSKIGCLVSAISYLHDQKVRHKDLKPSNILLSRDGLWLSDFGSATDFSLLSQSATNNERGSPRYFSPEVASWQPSGRAADIFSLGCVLLEIVVLHDQGTLHHMQQNRSTRDPSFHANLGSIDIWCEGSQAKSHIASWSSRRTHLVQKIKSMLAYDPTMRPSAQQLLLEITGYDLSRMITTKHSIFGRCCRSCLIPIREHAKELAANKDKIRSLQNNLGKTRKALRKRDLERSGLVAKYERRLNTRQSKITNQRINLRNARKRLENNQSENDRATLKLQRQMADHKGTITRMQAEREMFSKELRKKHAENTRLSKEQIVSNIRLLADQERSEELDGLRAQVGLLTIALENQDKVVQERRKN